MDHLSMGAILRMRKMATMSTWIHVEDTSMERTGIIIIQLWWRHPIQRVETSLPPPSSAQLIVGRAMFRRFPTSGCHLQTGVGLLRMLEKQKIQALRRRSIMITRRLTLHIRLSTEMMWSKSLLVVLHLNIMQQQESLCQLLVRAWLCEVLGLLVLGRASQPL